MLAITLSILYSKILRQVLWCEVSWLAKVKEERRTAILASWSKFVHEEVSLRVSPLFGDEWGKKKSATSPFPAGFAALGSLARCRLVKRGFPFPQATPFKVSSAYQLHLLIRPCKRNPDSGIIEIFACRIWYLGHFALKPESWAFKSGIQLKEYPESD